jgi:predicted nucleic acid-binding protein
MNAVDTNIFLYSIDHHEPAKQMKAQQLLRHLHAVATPTFLFWQVLGELVQQLRRWEQQGKLTHAEFLQHGHVFRHLFPLVLPTAAVLDRALDLAERYSLSHWDSMILGACVEAGVKTLYTEDMGASRTIDGLQLLNPLV